MNDDTPPHGIRRPSPVDLAEADEYTVIAAALRAQIRAAYAAACSKAAEWTPGDR
jgi:hypothetical protein